MALSCSASASALRSRCSASSASLSRRERSAASRDARSVRRSSRSESRTQATPIQARYPAWVTMNRVTAGCDDAGWCTVACSTYAAVVTTTARAVNEGRKRNATATGIRKKARRAWEYAPPESTARMQIARMSIAVATMANRSPARLTWT